MNLTSNTQHVVYFDLGNTLLHYHRGDLTDQEKDYIGIYNIHQRLSGWNLDVSISTLIEGFYRPWSRLLRYRKRKKVEYDVVQYLLAVLPSKDMNNRRLKMLILDFFEPTLRFSEPGAEVVPSLAKLSEEGFKLAVISNSPLPGYCHDRALKKHGILPYISFSLYSYDVAKRKPNLELFELALRMAGSKPSRATMVGDSKQLDIAPALAMGMSTILYSENLQKDEIKNVNTATNFEAVADLVLSG